MALSHLSFGRVVNLAAATAVALLICALCAAPGAGASSFQARCRAGQGAPWLFVTKQRKPEFRGHWYAIAVYSTSDEAFIQHGAPIHLCRFIRQELPALTRVKNHHRTRIRITSPGQRFQCTQAGSMWALLGGKASTYDEGIRDCTREIDFKPSKGKVVQRFRIVPESIIYCDLYFDASGAGTPCPSPVPLDAHAGP